MNPVDALWDVVDAVGKAIGDGFTLAAEILCPRDHTAEQRLKAWESAAVAVEDEICDEADACETANEAFSIEDLFELRNRRYADSLQSSWRFVPDSSAAVSAAADPSPTVPNAHSVVGGEGSGGASDILKSAPPERPGHDDSFLIECTSPTCNCHGDPNYAPRESDPGAVSTPAPGEAKQCQYADAGGCIDIYACTECPPIDRSVSEDDLTAHIMGDFVSGQEVDPLTATLIDAISSHIARALLADFHITRK